MNCYLKNGWLRDPNFTCHKLYHLKQYRLWFTYQIRSDSWGKQSCLNIKTDSPSNNNNDNCNDNTNNNNSDNNNNNNNDHKNTDNNDNKLICNDKK